MRSKSIITLTALIILAAPISAQADTVPKVSDALFFRPLVFLLGVGGTIGTTLFSPYSFTDGAVRSVVQSVREKRPVGQAIGDTFVEGARGVTRSFSQAGWCPIEHAVATPLGSREPCKGIAWSDRGVFAPTPAT